MNLFDSHVHLDYEPLANEVGQVVEKAYKVGVTRMINVGASLRGSGRSVELAEQYPNIWAALGLHPHEAEAAPNLDLSLEKIKGLARSDKVVAIGEIGLDYFKDQVLISRQEKKLQKELFWAQLKLALELDLPVVFHVREAWDDFFEIISEDEFKDIRGVIHCFTGDEKIAREALKHNLLIGFTGFVTFAQSKFDHIRAAVKTVSLERILIETDAPFLAPEPYRGKPNEPAYVVEVARKIASLKGVEVAEVAEKTTNNTKKLFNI